MSERPTIIKQDGTVLVLGNGVETDVQLTEEECEVCLEPMHVQDYDAVYRMVHAMAVSKGLPDKLPEGKQYSFGGYSHRITVVPKFMGSRNE